ncbi:autotransporter assembly complex protein TamA [Oleisolibacter albus]|uniref:autotransporter assembly complex protein TamA n=1 Tax=Oleisolibacter albus TaxID=2171757 RepID=UPI0012D7D4C6|nr:autotransporter assembly complex family protein [Oleisolibacter albus]
MRLRSLLLATVVGLSVLAPPPARAQDTPYTVEISGAEGGLETRLSDVSRLVGLRESPPPSPLGLRRRAEADRERLAAALRSEGYFDAVLDIDVDVGQSPAKVAIAVEPGPRYSISSVTLTDPDGNPLPEGLVTAADLGLAVGSPATGQAVLDAEGRVPARLAERSRAFARVIDRQLVVDHATRGMDVTYRVDPGPEVHIGRIQVNGLQQVEERAVRRRRDFKIGDPYKPSLLEDYRQALADLEVFSSVRVRLGEQVDADGRAPVQVDVQEREMRFVGFGLKYGTEDGFGGNAYWGHRNLLGGAERFRLSAAVDGIGRNSTTDPGQYDYTLAATYREPDFLSRRQALTLSAQAISERPDAYRRKALVLTSVVERPLAHGITASLGATLEQSRIIENEQTTSNTLLGIPAALTIDRSNDLLNPTAGWRLNAAATPYWAALGDSSSFTIARVGGTAYLGLDAEDDFVLAGRAVYGAIVGGGLLNVPADKRFYAGGGGSIRGYGYQDVGPRDAEGDPRGGLSLFEASTELRFKVAENIGVVAFLDAGNVYETEYPTLGAGLRYGAGLGARYYTPIGPIRVDAAVPLNKRSGDSAFQLYVSIGQAF